MSKCVRGRVGNKVLFAEVGGYSANCKWPTISAECLKRLFVPNPLFMWKTTPTGFASLADNSWITMPLQLMHHCLYDTVLLPILKITLNVWTSLSVSCCPTVYAPVHHNISCPCFTAYISPSAGPCTSTQYDHPILSLVTVSAHLILCCLGLCRSSWTGISKIWLLSELELAYRGIK